jgi:6-phosphogluconolactonase/glucosamine-6-phosphate isomerase/deaminase
MTLTYPPIDRARIVLWLVTGEDKRAALGRLRAGDPSVPAGRVATAEQVLFCDRAAWGS